MRLLPALASIAASWLLHPAAAAPNLLANGSFEQGLAGWTLANPAPDTPVVTIAYGPGAAYPTGAFGEAIPAADAPTLSPDAAGNRSAYFVGDFASAETLSQSLLLAPGIYRVGFSLYVPQNGQDNPGEAGFAVTLLGLTLADLKVSGTPARRWLGFGDTVRIGTGGSYLVSMAFQTSHRPSKDLLVDQVYVEAVPAPAGLAVFGAALAGFGLLRLWPARRTRPLEQRFTKG